MYYHKHFFNQFFILCRKQIQQSISDVELKLFNDFFILNHAVMFFFPMKLNRSKCTENILRG